MFDSERLEEVLSKTIEKKFANQAKQFQNKLKREMTTQF